MKHALIISLLLVAAQCMAADDAMQQTGQTQQADKPAQPASAPKDTKSGKEKPRMKSVEEVWGNHKGEKAGFPRLGGL